jgi:stage II sporulation protein M
MTPHMLVLIGARGGSNMSSWNMDMRNHAKENVSLYIFVSVLFVMGVIFGALMVNALSLEQKQEVTRYLGSFFHSVDQGLSVDAKTAFWQAFFMHIKWVGLIWILGCSVVGLPIVLILDFFKGVLVGFTVGYMVGQLSWKGVLFALASVAPQNLIIIPALMISSVAAISFSMYIVKNRFFQQKGSIRKPFMTYSLVNLSMVFLLLGASLLEAFVSPILMKWVTPMLIASETFAYLVSGS